MFNHLPIIMKVYKIKYKTKFDRQDWYNYIAKVVGDRIEGLNTEDKDDDEGTIKYDIRFIARIPKQDENIRIIINVEAQKNFYPGYPILSRGVYYGARMISSQNGVEFIQPYYGDILLTFS